MRHLYQWGIMAAACAALAAPASAQFAFFENFEDGLTGWSLWTERGTNLSTASGEESLATLGNVPPQSGANNNFAFVGGNDFNGGIWQVITLPGPGSYTVDGYWRSNVSGSNNSWGEVIIREGSAPPTNGSDVAGPLRYKDDNFSGDPTWNGLISTTSDQAGGAAGGAFTTASGTITLVLKAGNSGVSSGTWFDDVYITPEPATALVLGMGAIPLLLLRGRRRAR